VQERDTQFRVGYNGNLHRFNANYYEVLVCDMLLIAAWKNTFNTYYIIQAVVWLHN